MLPLCRGFALLPSSSVCSSAALLNQSVARAQRFAAS